MGIKTYVKHVGKRTIQNKIFDKSSYKKSKLLLMRCRDIKLKFYESTHPPYSNE